MSGVHDFDPLEKDFLDVPNQLPEASLDISPLEKLRFGLASYMLLAIFVLCVCIFYFYAHDPDNVALKEMFEFVKVSMMPLVVLIVSFYFKNN